jgi:protein-tyrosine phosphatase
MRGFVDLHCHWVACIDDGASSPAAGIEMLGALKAIGFDRVIATPHMRPGMFDNTRADLEAAFSRMQLPAESALPEVALSSEHYFDDVIFSRLMNDQGLPYPGGKAVLLEFYEIDFPPSVQHRLFDLRGKKQLLPVIAHPERYHAIWKSPELLEDLVDAGIATLLDAAALVGKYGKKPQRCAEELLDRGLYHAACSDAHRPSDIAEVAAGMRRIEQLYGDEEIEFLFSHGPRELLAGRIPE